MCGARCALISVCCALCVRLPTPPHTYTAHCLAVPYTVPNCLAASYTLQPPAIRALLQFCPPSAASRMWRAPTSLDRPLQPQSPTAIAPQLPWSISRAGESRASEHAYHRGQDCIYAEYIVSRVHLGAGAGVQPCAMRIGWGVGFPEGPELLPLSILNSAWERHTFTHF